MEIRQLRNFLAVANARSFLGAEESLFISRQAISKTINQLESELGITLFVRNQSGAMMTPAGIYFYSRAAALVASFDRITEEMHDISRSYRPKIRICMALGLHNLYADKLNEYSQQRKNEFELEIVSRLDVDCDTALSDRRADAVLSFSPQSNHTADTTQLMESPIVLLVPKGNPWAKLSPEDIMKLPRLLYTGGRERCLWVPDAPRPEDYCSSEFAHLFTLLQRGHGILPIPRAMIPDYVDFAAEIPAPPEMVTPGKTYFSTLYPSYYDSLTYNLLDAILDDVLMKV